MPSSHLNATENEQAVFKQSVKDWMAANKITMKSLSSSIGVSYGTVRNWFSSDLVIGEESRKRIESVMRNPSAIKKKVKQSTEVYLLNISPFTANMAMWRSAASAPDVYFNQSVYTSTGADAKAFAEWSTLILNEAIKRELQKHPIEKIKALANKVHFAGDPVCSAENDDEAPETDEEFERRTQGIPIKLPIFYSQINSLYLVLAASCANKHRDDFIADALNEAANADFGEELEDFLKSETTFNNEAEDALPDDNPASIGLSDILPDCPF